MVAKPDDQDWTAGDPTPREIELRCQEIQKRWSERMRTSRRCTKPARWMPPICSSEDGWELDSEKE